MPHAYRPADFCARRITYATARSNAPPAFERLENVSVSTAVPTARCVGVRKNFFLTRAFWFPELETALGFTPRVFPRADAERFVDALFPPRSTPSASRPPLPRRSAPEILLEAFLFLAPLCFSSSARFLFSRRAPSADAVGDGVAGDARNRRAGGASSGRDSK